MKKGDPAPDIKLQYLDSLGKPMSAKEAFRELSHRFHGKKPGKKKLEKRKKKIIEETERKKRIGTDTPLGTLSKLQNATKQTGRAFIVLDTKKSD